MEESEARRGTAGAAGVPGGTGRVQRRGQGGCGRVLPLAPTKDRAGSELHWLGEQQIAISGVDFQRAQVASISSRSEVSGLN